MWKKIGAFTIVEVLVVIFLISLLYISFANIDINYQPKAKLVTNHNLCYELKKLITSPTDHISLVIYTGDGDKTITRFLHNDSPVEAKLKLNIDYKNIYDLDLNSDLIEKVYPDITIGEKTFPVLFRFEVFDGGFCTKYVYKIKEKYYIQYPFENSSKEFDPNDIKKEITI